MDTNENSHLPLKIKLIDEAEIVGRQAMEKSGDFTQTKRPTVREESSLLVHPLAKKVNFNLQAEVS